MKLRADEKFCSFGASHLNDKEVPECKESITVIKMMLGQCRVKSLQTLVNARNILLILPISSVTIFEHSVRLDVIWERRSSFDN